MTCKLLNTIKMLFILFQLLLFSAYAAQPEVGKQYTLENALLKSAKVLSLDAQNKLYMEPVDATNSKQKWEFSQGPNGTFYMHNVALGVTKAVDSDANRPDIRNKGNYTGQYWQFTQVGDWLFISNQYQGLGRVLDTVNATGNYLFFDNKTNRTSGKFWKLKALAPVTTSTPVASTTTTTVVPTTTTSTELTVTTTTLTLDPKTFNTQQCQEGYVWVEASDGPLFSAPARCELAPDPDAMELVVKGLDCSTPELAEFCKTVNASRNEQYSMRLRCAVDTQTKSLLLSHPSNVVFGPALPNNDCRGPTSSPSSLNYFRSYESEYRKVSQYFIELENAFIQALKENPSEVLNYDNAQLLEELKVTQGKVSYSRMEAFVYGSLVNSILKKAEERSDIEQAAVEWIINGSRAVELMAWKKAQRYYQRWYLDPCSFRPPQGDKWDGMYVGCGSGGAGFGEIFKIGKTQSAHPPVKKLIKWGVNDVGQELVVSKEDELFNRNIAMGGVFIGTTAAATGAAITGSMVAGKAAIAAVFASSASAVAVKAGGVMTVSIGWFTGVSTAGAAAVAGPAIIFVGAVAGTTAAILMTIEDNQFHKQMNTDEVIYTVYGKQIKLSDYPRAEGTAYIADRLSGRTASGPLAGIAELFGGNDTNGAEFTKGTLEFAFHDAMSKGNARRYLPVTVPLTAPASASAIEPKQPVKITAALTRANGKATYLFYSDGTYAKTSANKSVGFDAGYPQKMPGGWSGIPTDWNSLINAAVPYQSTTKGYMWSEGKYLRLNDVKVDAGYPTNMPGGWQNMPAGWAGNVDAAIHYQPNNRHYFFKGTEYVRLTGTRVDTGYPTKLPGGWVGMPATFVQGIDAATYRNGHVYMIKGDQYIRFSGTKVDAGYPKSMTYWPQ